MEVVLDKPSLVPILLSGAVPSFIASLDPKKMVTTKKSLKDLIYVIQVYSILLALLRIIALVCLRTSSLHFSPRKKVGLDHALHLEYPIQNETRHPISYSSKGCSPRGYARYLLLSSDIVHSFSIISLDLVLMDHSHGAVMINRLILATYLY